MYMLISAMSSRYKWCLATPGTIVRFVDNRANGNFNKVLELLTSKGSRFLFESWRCWSFGKVDAHSLKKLVLCRRTELVFLFIRYCVGGITLDCPEMAAAKQHRLAQEKAAMVAVSHDRPVNAYLMRDLTPQPKHKMRVGFEQSLSQHSLSLDATLSM